MPRVSMRFSPNHTRSPNVPFYFLDIDVEGMEDQGVTHIGDRPSLMIPSNPYQVTRNTVVSYDPSVIQIAVRVDDNHLLPIDYVDLALLDVKTYAESEGLARRLERHWYVQELTFSHFVKHGWFKKTPVYRATDVRRFIATAGIHSWFLSIGDVIERPDSASDLAPAEVAA